MAVNSTINFEDASDFTYDPNEIDISGNKARLASQVPSTELAYFNFNTDGDFSSTRGGVSLTPAGVVDISGGKLNFTDNLNANVTAPSTTLNGPEGAVQFKFTSNVASIVSQTSIFAMYDPTNTVQGRVILVLTNQGGGITRINAIIKDDAGVVTTTIMETFTMVIGQEYDMLFSWNLNSGDVSFFLDGVHSHTVNLVKTLTYTTDFLTLFGTLIGSYTGNPDYSIDDIQTHNSAIKEGITDSFPVPVIEAAPYLAESAGFYLNTLFTLDAISSFTDVVTLNSGLVQYALRINSILYWWNGAAWAVSDGTIVQSNTALEINTNADTLPVSAGVTMRVEFFIQATDLYQTPEIDTTLLSYNFVLTSTDPVLCLVYGTVKDNSGNPVAGAKLTFDTPDHWYGENFIAPSKTVFTNSEGLFFAALVETETSGQTSTAIIEYKQAGKTKKVTYTGLVIPNKTLEKLSDLV